VDGDRHEVEPDLVRSPALRTRSACGCSSLERVWPKDVTRVPCPARVPVSAADYLFRSQLWLESLQNRQSEFMAVGMLVVLSVFLRQRGSPESKPVHAPHYETGSD